MHNEEIILQGRIDRIDELLSDLSSIEGIYEVTVKSSSSVSNSILAREPLKQFEIAEIIIGVTVNLASSALYDLIREKINERAKKKGFIRKYSELDKQRRRIDDGL